MSGFKMNPNIDLQSLVAPKITLMAQDWTRAADAIFDQYQGQSANEIKEPLRVALKRAGATIGDPELSQYATQISEGTRLVFRPAKP